MNNKDKVTILRKKADFIRKEVIDISVRNKAGHIAPSLSCVDILVALYYEAMLYKPEDPLWEGRDRLIFSKGHGCYALYAILSDRGIISKHKWESFYKEDDSLSGCVERNLKYGIEAGCGSLGHGLPIAVGLAFGAQIQKRKYYTFCIVGDGELQEGTTWEALQFAVKHQVRNLVIIIDSNRLQAMDFIVNVLDREKGDKVKRLRGFGLSPVVCPGHDAARIVRTVHACKSSSQNTPKVIIAETIKGFGLRCMQNLPKFHFRIPNEKELSIGKSYES